MSESNDNLQPPHKVIDAEIVDVEVVDADSGEPYRSQEALVDMSVQRLSAKGGAVGAVLLGLLGLAGMAFSSYSLFNVILAAMFALWGLKSPMSKTAVAGLLLSLAGLAAFLATLK